MWFYSLGMKLYGALIALVSLWYPKARLWREGRRGLFARMAAAISPDDRIVWVHAASLGEFEQGRPIMERIRREHPEYKILLTFFSPSGYEVRKNYAGADYIFYLPLDTPSAVRRFVELAHPEAVVFVKYEFWLNLLAELRRRKVRTYVVSAIFRPDSIFFRPYGGAWRQALETFDTIFVQNDESKRLLAGLGFDNVAVAGDTRFDRVAEIAATAHRVELVERFRASSPLFVAGSTWGPDEEILLPLVNGHPDVKFVVAPHEMEEERIVRLMAGVKGGAVRYTQCTDATSFDGVQLLVLDTVGILSSVYASATWAYVGGGFGIGIHNTLEAATFGLPVAFGPNYRKFKEARDMVSLGCAVSVASAGELAAWFAPLRDVGGEALLRAGRIAREYTAKNQGATGVILRTLFHDLE